MIMTDIDKQSLNGAQWLAQTLAKNQVSHVFFIDAVLRNTLVQMGIPGEHAVKRVLAHSEKSAAYMADGYARISGRPGFCFAQSVGAANLAAGLQDAWLGQSPVIALTGRKPATFQHRNAYQEIPHTPLFSAVTKRSAAVDTADDLPRLLRQACRDATTGRPGPVHLDMLGIYGDQVERDHTSQPVASIDALQHGLAFHRTAPDAERLQAAAQQLNTTNKIVIVAGRGATLSGAGPALLAVAEKLQAPIATELGALELVPYDHPGFIGAAGRYAAPPANEIIYQADLVFFIGSDTGELVTDAWQVPGLHQKVMQIDVDPAEFGRSYADTFGLAGDPKATLTQLLPLIDAKPADAEYLQWAQERVQRWRSDLRQDETSTATPIHVSRLMDAINTTLPADAIVVADTGFSATWTATHLQLDGDKQQYLHAAGSLGWAFPAAIGAKCAAPDRPVLCFTGDGGLYYHLSELETAKRLGYPLVVVVNNNSGFGQGWKNIRNTQGELPGDPREIACFGPTDFAAIAKAFGIQAHRVEQPDALEATLRDAFAANEVVLIDVITDFELRTPEPWLPTS